MRVLNQQPVAPRSDVTRGKTGKVARVRTSSVNPTTTIAYDGATGTAKAAKKRRTAKVEDPESVTQIFVKGLAKAVNATTPAARRRALERLAKVAESSPDEVRESLRFSFDAPTHKLVEYEREIATSLGTEGARLYMEHMYATADSLKKAGTPKIALVNATFTGGGVAEMFQNKGQVLRQLGVDVEWQKTWDHDGDYGEIGRKAFDAFQGGGTVITQAEHARWEAHNKLLARMYRSMATDPNVSAIYLEDHHAIHFIAEIKKANPHKRIIWRSHVDMAGVLEGKKAAIDLWEKAILPNLKLLGPNDAVFFQPGSVPKGYDLPCSVFVCPPGIDPLAPKNQRLTWERAKEILKKEVPSLDFNLKYLVTGGRFVAFKGNVLVQRAFLSIAKDYSEFGLFTFAGIGTGDDRKLREAALYDASLAEYPEEAKRLYRMDDRTSEQIGAAYALAAHSELPYIAASVREGYGMVADEAARQGAAPMTLGQGGFSRYDDELETAAFTVRIDELASQISDPTRMYTLVDGKVVASPEAQAIQDRIAAKLREIFDAQRNDPYYSRRYRLAAEVAERITLEHSLPVLCRNYLAVAAATPEQLERAAQRVKTQGAAHVACVADVIGEDTWGR